MISENKELGCTNARKNIESRFPNHVLFLSTLVINNKILNTRNVIIFLYRQTEAVMYYYNMQAVG